MNLSDKLNINKPSGGDKGVTVYCVDGSSFIAQSRGAVLKSDYVPSPDVIDELLEVNTNRIEVQNDPDYEFLVDGLTIPEIQERAITIQARIDEAERLNRKYYSSLPRYYDYTPKGRLKNGKK